MAVAQGIDNISKRNQVDIIRSGYPVQCIRKRYQGNCNHDNNVQVKNKEQEFVPKRNIDAGSFLAKSIPDNEPQGNRYDEKYDR
jgi:hypothetical protein